MNTAIKKIGVLTSGGDAPGMNAAIRAVVLTAEYLGFECLGVRRGYTGLINGDIFPISARNVTDIIGRGGTMLFSARSDEFMEQTGQRRGAENCRFFGMDGLVIIGGDGSFQGAERLSRLGVPVIGIPATIDNDIGCSAYTIGFNTACNTAIDAVDKLNDTMQSHERCSVVEVMGHRTGYLALNVAIATGATVILIPEFEVDFERDVIGKICAARMDGHTHFTVIVAEGAASADEVARRIHKETEIETRVTTLGHIQRGGSPLVYDRVTASHMGYRAVHLLASGDINRVVAMEGGKCVDYDIAEALEMTKSLDEDAHAMQEILMN